VKFPVTEAGKEIREPTTMDLTQFPTVETLPPQGKESPLMNWWLRMVQGEVGALFFQESVHWLA
jgi:hypothetical protein